MLPTATTLSSFGLAGWIELAGALVVAVGCLGELWVLLNRLTMHIEPIARTSGPFWRTLALVDRTARPFLVRLKIGGRRLPVGKEELIERLFVSLVALGVSVEFACLPFTLYESAKLNQKAEVLEQENLKLSLQIQPRRISVEQKSFILGALKNRFVGNPRVNIVTESTDMEQRVFARQIKEALDDSGFSVHVFETTSLPNSFGAEPAPIQFGMTFGCDPAVLGVAQVTLSVFKAAGVAPIDLPILTNGMPFMDAKTLVIETRAKPLK